MQRYRKIALLFSLCALVLVGCVPKTKTGTGADAKVVPVAGLRQAEAPRTRATPIESAIRAAAGSKTGSDGGKMVGMQEQEMRSALARSEASAVQRHGDLLVVVLQGDLAFDTNSAAIRPGVFSEVERMSNVLDRYPKSVIQVGGHTDGQGSEAYNLTLSQQRADAIKNLMAQLGIIQSRIEAAAFGESQPIASNETEAGRKLNRRVEIKIAPAL